MMTIDIAERVIRDESGAVPMIPAQLIRSLGQAARLLGLEARHRAALELEESATLEDVVELLDELAERVSAAPPPGSGRARRVLELVAEGLRDPEIAERLGLTAHAVRGIRRAAAIPGHPGRARTGWEERITAAHGRGLTNEEIAEATGYTLRSVQQRLHELGLRANTGR